MMRLLFLLILLPQIALAQINYRGAQMGLFPSEQDVRDLIRAGANLARYQVHSVGWEAAKTASCSHYKAAAESYLNHLDTLLHLPIRWVIDLHIPIGGRINGRDNIFDNPWMQDCMVSFWIDTAHKYKGKKRVLAYDLYNEPLGTEDEVRSLMNRMYKAVRAIDRRKNIILAGTQHSAKSFSTFRKKNDDRVWYSLHFYDPGNFTHHGVFTPSNTLATYNGTQATLEVFMRNAISFSKKHPKAIIYVGEFGAACYTQPASRFKWFKQTLSLLEQYKFLWTYHAFREWECWGVEDRPKIYKLIKSYWKKNANIK